MNTVQSLGQSTGMAKMPQKDAVPAAKPLMNELGDLAYMTAGDRFRNNVNMSVSSNAVNLYELSQEYPAMFSLKKQFSGDVLHQVDRLILLHRTMRTMWEESGETLDNPFQQKRFDAEELAAAYDRVMQTTNAGNRHLDDAFRNLARFIFADGVANQARHEWWNTPAAGELDRSNNPSLTEEQLASQNEFISNAVEKTERQANLFADVFLRNYKRYGMEAFNMAMAAVTQ